MGYTNVFSKLDQDLSNQIKTLQAKQQELLERKKNLLAKKQKIQGFLTDAQEVRKILDAEPELIESLQIELAKIFTANNQPKLPIKKENNVTVNLEEPKDKNKEVKTFTPSTSVNLQEEESIKIFQFVDAQGKNTSF
ncbi:hypothetical protein [Geminocystis sp. NIES-3709]|uniref:hypothetical protein n=1 Tax=Geminocystis sp. NIES-3709 TaxID=1617448 RepID=UPI0005FC482E|nr:hypothetical protein [Geminocystis sp. NIES-3709]BAQ66222.1 hypothetical protein GM3709_2987 [Geminocystis sp. NIES-3709]